MALSWYKTLGGRAFPAAFTFDMFQKSANTGIAVEDARDQLPPSQELDSAADTLV